MVNKKAARIITIRIKINIFLFSLIKKVFPLQERKSKNIKIRETPKPRYEPRVKVKSKLPPIAKIPMNNNNFLNLLDLNGVTKKKDTARGRISTKYSAK